MSAQKTLHEIEDAIASCSRHLLFASLALIFLTFRLHAQNPVYYPRNPNPTAQQQWDASQAYQQQQRQEAIEIQREEMQDKIDGFNSDILSKSNALERLLTPSRNPYLVSACERTNAAERIKELPEQKMGGLKNILKGQHPWRKIDGKTVLVSGDSGFVGYTGKILQTTSSGILIQSYVSPYMPPDLQNKNIFIKNFPYVYADGTEIPSILAVPCEPTSIFGGSEIVNAADYGIPCSQPSNAEEIEAAEVRVTPAEEEHIKKDADSALAEITNAQMELTMARKHLQDFFDKIEADRQAIIKAKEAKKNAIQAKILKSNQEDANKGDAYGLLRMGQRYRDGDGVQKDLSKAHDYLTKAATAGSPTAAAELSKLNQVSTNSPATQ